MGNTSKSTSINTLKKKTEERTYLLICVFVKIKKYKIV